MLRSYNVSFHIICPIEQMLYPVTMLEMLICFLALLIFAEAAVTPRCDKPAYHGPCDESQTRWYYNKASGQCQTFTYGGCLGNDNRFESENDCENACESEYANCELPKDVGPCRYGTPRRFYNSATGKCERFIYGGCGGNANRFDSQSACEVTCKPATPGCTAPSVIGSHMRGLYTKWYYNSQSGQCDTYTYDGYDVSDNRFNTRNGCEKACQSPVLSSCDKPLALGTCGESLTRWFYNKTSGQCENFLYSGCLGNDNRFETASDCENTCESEYANCELPKDPGTCRYGVPNYYYNTASSQCERFIYGSCGGNANRFDRESGCKLTCEPAVHSCTAPSDVNSRRGSYTRWYFNINSRQCQSFDYSGYDVNGVSDNRFNTRNGCEKACQ